jgi:hypothetical protein
LALQPPHCNISLPLISLSLSLSLSLILSLSHSLTYIAEQDPYETTDLSITHPKILAEMMKKVKETKSRSERIFAAEWTHYDPRGKPRPGHHRHRSDVPYHNPWLGDDDDANKAPVVNALEELQTRLRRAALAALLLIVLLPVLTILIFMRVKSRSKFVDHHDHFEKQTLIIN